MPKTLSKTAQKGLKNHENALHALLMHTHPCNEPAFYTLMHNGELLGSLHIQRYNRPLRSYVTLWITGYPVHTSSSVFGSLAALRAASAHLPPRHPLTRALKAPVHITTRVSKMFAAAHLHNWKPLLKEAKIILDI